MDIAVLLERLKDFEARAIELAARKLLPTSGERLQLYKSKLEQLEAAHSRSWFGDHSSTYYRDFEAPPGGRSFDVEWGFVLGFNGSRNPNWITYSRPEIQKFVFGEIGEGILQECHSHAEDLASDLLDIRDQALGLLEVANIGSVGRYVKRINEDISPFKFSDYITSKSKETPRMTRDSEEISKGSFVPAHVQYFSAIQSFDVNLRKSRELSKILRGIIELVTLTAAPFSAVINSNRIFIGHGRSEQWRILKDFVRDKLGLEYEEFNRISAAGLNTQERLRDMLDSCGFAFLIMTAEDLRDDGTFRARENVVHECGLFQGRLGWRKAIVLLEDGCEEFSNIIGLGQIRFPKGNIAACFEQIRDVLKRESLIEK